MGRSAAGRKLGPEAVRLAVVASIRHTDTGCDSLPRAGVGRAEARAQVRPEARARVRPEVDRVLGQWSTRPAGA